MNRKKLKYRNEVIMILHTRGMEGDGSLSSPPKKKGGEDDSSRRSAAAEQRIRELEEVIKKAASEAAAQQLQQEQLNEQLLAAEARWNEKANELTVVAGELAKLKKKMERFEEIKRIDRIASEGQTKKLRILEHEVLSTREEYARNRTLLDDMKGRNAELEKKWKEERSLRLQDLHRNHTLAACTQKSGMSLKDTETRLLEVEGMLQAADERVRLRDIEIEAQRLVEEAHLGELAAQAEEMNLLKTSEMELKRMLLQRDALIEEGYAANDDMLRQVMELQKVSLATAAGHTARQRVLTAMSRHPTRTSTRGATAGSAGSRLFTAATASSMPMTAGAESKDWWRGGRRGDDPGQSRSSTLQVSGSLFVSRGLGMRKGSAVDVRQGMGLSPKAYISRFLERETMTTN